MRDKIRLIAVDMDGTLLGSDGHISERNAYVISCIQNEGMEFLVCTGRSYEDAVRPLREKKLRSPIVCMNGACTYDNAGHLLEEVTFSREQVEAIMDCCEPLGVIFDFMTDRGSYSISSEEVFQRSYEQGILLPMAQTGYEAVRERFCLTTREGLRMEGLRFYKISLLHESRKVLFEAARRVAQIGKIAIASSHETNLELTHEDAQKGKALAAYAQSKGIRLQETMAIGDSENDRSMFTIGLKYTIAMENAMESVKKIARIQTRANDEDGVAYAIETLALGRV